MSGRRDSNSRPRPWQGRALPTELLPLLQSIIFYCAANIEFDSKNHNEEKRFFILQDFSLTHATLTMLLQGLKYLFLFALFALLIF